MATAVRHTHVWDAGAQVWAGDPAGVCGVRKGVTEVAGRSQGTPETVSLGTQHLRHLLRLRNRDDMDAVPVTKGHGPHAFLKPEPVGSPWAQRPGWPSGPSCPGDIRVFLPRSASVWSPETTRGDEEATEVLLGTHLHHRCPESGVPWVGVQGLVFPDADGWRQLDSDWGSSVPLGRVSMTVGSPHCPPSNPPWALWAALTGRTCPESTSEGKGRRACGLHGLPGSQAAPSGPPLDGQRRSVYSRGQLGAKLTTVIVLAAGGPSILEQKSGFELVNGLVSHRGQQDGRAPTGQSTQPGGGLAKQGP